MQHIAAKDFGVVAYCSLPVCGGGVINQVGGQVAVIAQHIIDEAAAQFRGEGHAVAQRHGAGQPGTHIGFQGVSITQKGCENCY